MAAGQRDVDLHCHSSISDGSLAPEEPERVAHILEQRLEAGQAAPILLVLLELGDAAEGEAR